MAVAAGISDSAERGRRIYSTGSPEVHARIGASDGGERIASTLVPCARCHGPNGRDGVAEGGLAPPDITWSALTKPYDVTTASGRKRQPYTEARLHRAIGMGFDSAGNALNSAMPRYEMSYQSMQDLIAWMKILGDAPVAGVSAEAVQVGVMAPAGPAGDTFRAAIAAYAAEANKQDGIFGRRLELRAGATGGVLCVLADTLDGAAWDKQTPLIAASPTMLPERLNPFVFYLHQGVQGEAEALASRASGSHAAVLFAAEFESVAETVARVWTGPPVRRVALEQEELLAAERPDVLFVLVRGWDAAVLRRHPDWRPALYVPGSLASDALLHFPATFAFPFLPSDRTAEAAREYQALAHDYSLPLHYTAIQSRGLAMMALLVKGLSDAGRDVTPQSLIAALEKLRAYPLGYTLPVTFTANQHVGSSAMRLALYDPATGAWRAIER